MVEPTAPQPAVAFSFQLENIKILLKGTKICTFFPPQFDALKRFCLRHGSPK
jgi:hypothetical protein